jgi:cytochrome b subunit of formate dehydrogenase
LFLVYLISEQITGMICGANSKFWKKQNTDYWVQETHDEKFYGNVNGENYRIVNILEV